MPANWKKRIEEQYQLLNEANITDWNKNIVRWFVEHYKPVSDTFGLSGCGFYCCPDLPDLKGSLLPSLLMTTVMSILLINICLGPR